jgi:ribose transport system ATP-binding protein
MDAGEIILEGKPLELTKPADALQAGIACVFQELSLIGNLTVTQNLFLGRERATGGVLARRSMRRATQELLASYDLAVDVDAPIAMLPVAQRQMLEIVGALNRDTKAILLDEPTTALEAAQVERLFRTLRRVVEERRIAIAIVDHKLDEVFAVCDRVTALTDGHVVLRGAIEDVSRADLTDAIVGTRKATHEAPDAGPPPPSPARSGSFTARPRPPASIPGESGEQGPEQKAEAGGGAVLEMQGVGGDRGLRDVNLTARAGEVLAIYGLGGSGRTQVLRTIYGLEPMDRGTMRLHGHRYSPRGPADALKSRVAYLSEERAADGFVPQFDAVRNCMLPVIGRYSRFGIVRRRVAARAASDLLAELEIRGDTHSPFTSLSGGNQQRALLAKAVFQNPVLLLMDEPTKGIDIGTKGKIHDVIRGLAEEHGIAVLFVSTEENEVLTLADEFFIIRRGKCDGTRYRPSELSNVDLRRLALEALPASV